MRIFLFAIFSIILTINNEGTPIYRDISLKGGLSAIINLENPTQTSEQIENNLQEKFPNNLFSSSEIFEKGKKNRIHN